MHIDRLALKFEWEERTMILAGAGLSSLVAFHFSLLAGTVNFYLPSDHSLFARALIFLCFLSGCV